MNVDEFRNNFFQIILKREWLFRFLFRLGFSFLGFLVINDSYGYMKPISATWIPIGLAVVCSFLPLNGIAFVMFLFLSVHLFALSIEVCVVFVILCMIVFMISKSFGSKSMFHMIYMIVLYRISLPFLSPVYEGFFGRKREVAPVIGGAAIAFYLRVIRLSAEGIKNDENQNALTIFRDNVISSQLFYVLLIAIAAVIILIKVTKELKVKNAWYYAAILGPAVGFVIMTVGYISTGNSTRINALITASVVALVFGLVLAFFFGDTKHAHRRELSFEDDEYYYHVVCIPKIRAQETEKKVKRITRTKKDLDVWAEDTNPEEKPPKKKKKKQKEEV